MRNVYHTVSVIWGCLGGKLSELQAHLSYRSYNFICFLRRKRGSEKWEATPVALTSGTPRADAQLGVSHARSRSYTHTHHTRYIKVMLSTYRQ